MLVPGVRLMWSTAQSGQWYPPMRTPLYSSFSLAHLDTITFSVSLPDPLPDPTSSTPVVKVLSGSTQGDSWGPSLKMQPLPLQDTCCPERPFWRHIQARRQWVRGPRSNKAWHIVQIYNYKAGVGRSWEPNMLACQARLRPTER